MRRRGRLILAAAAGLLLFVGVSVAVTLARMPLYVDYPAAGGRSPAPVAAVLVSGDMGLDAGMGHHVAEGLAARGIPVVGINAPAFFLRARSADEVGGLVTEAARRALAAHPGARLLMVGQSFGSDVLPAGINRLPPEIRSRVAAAALVVPTRTVYYRISPAEYFEWGEPDAHAAVEAARLGDLPLVCVHGSEEPASLCPLLSGANLVRLTLPGDHYLGRDPARVTAALGDAVTRALAMTKAS